MVDEFGKLMRGPIGTNMVILVQYYTYCIDAWESNTGADFGTTRQNVLYVQHRNS